MTLWPWAAEQPYHLLRRRPLGLAEWRGRAPAPVPEQPALEVVEVEIDHRRRIERQDLRQCQTSDNGIAEWLPYLRAHTRSHHHGYRAEHGRHRRHQDRPEALDAGLVDRLFSIQAFIVFGMQGKVD